MNVTGKENLTYRRKVFFCGAEAESGRDYAPVYIGPTTLLCYRTLYFP